MVDTTIHSVGVIKWERGLIAICVGETGRVHIRINQNGEEMILNLSPEHALTVAQFIEIAATGKRRAA